MKRFGVLILVVCLLMTSVLMAENSAGRMGLGVSGSMIKLIGGTGDQSVINYLSAVWMKYSFSEALTGEATIGLGWVRPRDPDSHFKAVGTYRTYLYPWSLNLRYNLMPARQLNPYIGAGVGVVHWNLRNVTGDDEWFPIPESGNLVTGIESNVAGLLLAGFEFELNEKWILDLGLRYTHMVGQDKDNIGTGDDNDGILELRLGLGMFFGGFGDRDGDGIENKFDADPDAPEDFDGFQDEDGMPDLDNDKDGILDNVDKAPNRPEDFDGFQDEDGIPDLDNDKDGVPDKQDKCINDPEDIDGFQDEDGCPDIDNDGDGIPDNEDKCPNKAENFNGYMDEDGCPEQSKESEALRRGEALVLPDVTFESGKAVLSLNAKKVLDRVFESLKTNSDIEVEIRGFTDSVGSAGGNLRLSQRRAEAVKDYLVDRGIAFGRLRAIGYGEANPIASNGSSEGRAKNRRIEFVPIEK